MSDDLGNIYFLSWSLFYLSHHNGSLCMAYMKDSHFVSPVFGILGDFPGFLKAAL